MNIYFLVSKRLLLLIGIYTVSRILFYIFNFHVFNNIPVTDLLLSFLHGIRFDLSILIIINTVFILFSILPFRFIEHKFYQTILKTLFLALNIPFIILNLTDLEYFKFTGKRITSDIINISEDITNQLWQFSIHYWYILLISLLFAITLFSLYPNCQPAGHNGLFSRRTGKLSHKYGMSFVIQKLTHPISIIFLICFCFIAVRGGFQLKPLRPNHAFVISPNILGILTLNTPFTFINTFFYEAGVEKVHYFKNDKVVLEIIKKPCLDDTNVYNANIRMNANDTTLRSGVGPNKNQQSVANIQQPTSIKDNIIIIILESFSSEYLGTGNSYNGFTPFLDSLTQEGIFFKNNFANGRTSMQALPAILAGIPALMDEPLITSIYQTNEIYGLGTILKQYGYQTSFFHGGKNGTMGLDMFSKIAGQNNYYGINEYPESKRDYDGNWGIFDEPFLQFFVNMLSEHKQPFFSVVFTLSSHQPYSIPQKYKEKFPKGELEIHESIGYTDFALKKFFETAKTKTWYNNTLFIITADHTQQSSKKNYQNVLGQYRVPLILFHPNCKFEIDNTKITQHADIMPSILDYLGLKTDLLTNFGSSFFNKNCEGFALNYSSATYRLIHKDYFLELTTNGNSRIYDFKNAISNTNFIPDDSHDMIKKTYEKELKAYIQYFNNGLIENKIYKFGK